MEFPGGLSAVLKLVHVLLSKLSYNLFPKLKHPRSPSPSFTLPRMSIWIKPFASWMTAGQSQSPSYTFTLQGLFSLLSHTPEVSLSPPHPQFFLSSPHPSSSSIYFLPKECVLCKASQGKRTALSCACLCSWEVYMGNWGW